MQTKQNAESNEGASKSCKLPRLFELQELSKRADNETDNNSVWWNVSRSVDSVFESLQRKRIWRFTSLLATLSSSADIDDCWLFSVQHIVNDLLSFQLLLSALW